MTPKPKLIKIVLLLVAASVLWNCSTKNRTFGPKTTVRAVTVTSYPELPDIKPLPPLNLKPWQYDFPRDLNVLVPKSETSCLKVPEQDRDDVYWERCGEFKILTNTNIFIGFDEENWKILINNFAILKERLYQYRQRMNAINLQRRQWREKSEKERQRVKEIELE